MNIKDSQLNMRTKINRKSDFDFIVLDSEGNAIDMPANDFTLDIWTWRSACRFRASSIGGVLKGCKNDGGKLRIYVDNPGFAPGKLVGKWVSYISNEEYQDGTQRTYYLISDFGIDMVDENTQINDVQVVAMMQYIKGASAYEIACEYGFDGTEQEWLDSLALPANEAAAECRALITEFSNAEAQRVANEDARTTNDATRAQQESARVSAEEQRTKAEANRRIAENTRDLVETTRQNAERNRDNAEAARVSAENTRKMAENARIAEEKNRQSNEEARVTAETLRESAETNRANAEAARVEAEQARAEEFAGFAATLAAKEDVANKVTSINAGADDVHYPSAKAVFDVVLPVNKEEHPTDEEIMQPTATYDNFGVYNNGAVYTSSWKAFVFKLNPDIKTHFRYASLNEPWSKHYIIMRKVANSGDAKTDFAPVSKLMQKMPQYMPSFAQRGRGYITCYGLYDKENPNDDLYLILNKSYSGDVNNIEVVTYTTLGSESVISMKAGNVFDNYEYIKARACSVAGNIFSLEDKIENVGIVYNTGGLIKYNISYQCVNIKLELGKYYHFSNYKWRENGGTNGANNMAFLIDINGAGRQLVSSDIKNDSSWRSESGFIITNNSISIQNQPDGNFVIKTPSPDDLLTTFDNLYLCLNVGFDGVSPINDLIINEGTTPKEPSISIFGYPLSSDNNEDNPLSGQIVGFFGDSITAGTEGGYVGKVKDKLSLGQAYNYGSSGADTARLVDIITGLNIRGGQYAAIDYNKYAAVTIMIGTNGGVSGNLNNDTPDISIYDINSFPYQYEAEGKTISSATLNEANDLFKLCFPNTFYGNIALCIEYIRWKNPNCQIFLITIPPNNRGNDISVRTGIFNICDKLGVPVIDAQCRAGLARYNLSFFSIDRTHLNVKGNELLASFIANELKRQYYKTELDNQ